jgi:hypothetical protein
MLKRVKRPEGEGQKHDWLRFVFAKLESGCKKAQDLLKNKVTFITFNYDLSLEHELREKFKSMDVFKGKGNIVEDFLKANIVHVYGQFTVQQSLSTSQDQKYKGMNLFNQAFNESRKIITMADSELGKSTHNIKEDHKQKLKQAKYVYILGYGFDDRNNSILGLKDVLTSKRGQHIYFTNFGQK